MKLIVSQILSSLQGLDMDYAKITKLTADTGFEETDTMATIAALKYILSTAAKFDCDDVVLENELQQLGLPKEHTIALCRPYREKKDAVREHLRNCTFRLTRLRAVDWRLDYVLSSSSYRDLAVPSGELKLELVDFLAATGDRNATPEHRRAVCFTLSDDKLRALDHELRAASALMESYTS